MFKKLFTIQNANKGYCIDQSLLIYQSEKEVVQYGLGNEREILRSISQDDFQGILKREEFVIGISNMGYTLLDSNFQTIKRVPVENGIGDYGLYNGSLIVVTTDYDYSLFLPKQGVQDVFTDKVLWEGNAGENIKIESNIAFAVSFKEISRREITGGDVKWSNEVNSDSFVPELMGVSNGLVIFGLQEKDKIIALNVENGDLLWERTTLPQYCRLDSSKNKIHLLTASYKAISPEDGTEISAFLDRSYFDSIGIFSQRSNFTMIGDHIITTDYKKGIIGAFNMITHKFDWVHEEPGVSFPAGKPIVYTEPYLFLHDNKDTLHVFKKV